MRKKFDKTQRSKTRYKKKIQILKRKEVIHYFIVKKKLPKYNDDWFDEFNDFWEMDEKSAEVRIFENTIYELINNMEKLKTNDENPTYYIYGINATFNGDIYNRDANQVPEDEWNILTNFICELPIERLRQLFEEHVKPIYPQSLICLGVLYESEDREELHRMLYGV